MQDRIDLPKPSYRGTRTLEETLVRLRANDRFLDRPVELAAVAQILWAGQGVRGVSASRTAPSVGGSYPLDLYVITDQAVARYVPEDHQLETHYLENIREGLYQATHLAEAVKLAPLAILITVDGDRAEQQYGAKHAKRFGYIEAGHVAQNILLQVYAMGLSGAAFAAFKRAQVSKMMRLPKSHHPLYVIAIGYARSEP